MIAKRTDMVASCWLPTHERPDVEGLERSGHPLKADGRQKLVVAALDKAEYAPQAREGRRLLQVERQSTRPGRDRLLPQKQLKRKEEQVMEPLPLLDTKDVSPKKCQMAGTDVANTQSVTKRFDIEDGQTSV